MPVTVEQLVRALTEHGLVSDAEVAPLAQGLPDDSGPHFLASELVRQNKLTKFQAAAAFQGKTAALVMGNYLILDRIGAGGMGQVFKARHRRMKRVVALKLLPPALTRSPENLSRFQREVEAAAQLEHPNIVSAYDADEANGVHFLVMQCVEGPNLQELIDRHGPLRVNEAVDCIMQAARGLDYAHRKGIVHRDIKPANLLRDADGAVKVLDMGLARMGEGTMESETPPPGSAPRIDKLLAGDTRPSESGLTQCGQIMGTVDYIAPEQSLDTRAADHRADIYSLGCTLYFLLVGRPVYTHDNIAKRLLAHREGPTPSLKAVRKDVPERVEAIFRRMVAKRKEDRYGSMADVASALQGYLEEVNQPLGPTPAFAHLEPSASLPGLSAALVSLDSVAQSSPSLPSISSLSLGLPPAMQRAEQRTNNRALLVAAGAVIAMAALFLVAILTLTFAGADAEEELSNAAVEVAAGEEAVPNAESETPPATEQIAEQPPAVAPSTAQQPQPQPQPAPQPAAIPSDPDQRLVLWALGVGGLVEVTKEGDANSVMLSGPPTTPVKVVGLYLRGRTVTDADLATFATLTSLARLDLTNTALGDSAVPYLVRLTALTELKLAGTRVTPAAADQIRAALPNCQVER